MSSGRIELRSRSTVPVNRAQRLQARSLTKLLLRLRAPTGLVLLLLVVLWTLIAARTSPYVLPSPQRVADTFTDMAIGGELWRHVVATLYRVFIGFLIGTGIALIVGLIASSKEFTKSVLRDLTAILNATSVFVWIVLALIWFGLTDRAPIFTTTMITLPVLLSNVLEGIETLDRKLIEMAHVYHFRTLTTFQHIIVPNLVPHLFSGMRVAFALGLRVSVVAEIFGVTSGVGYMMNYARDTLRTDAVFAWAVTMILMMLIIDNTVFAQPQKWLTRWR